MRNTHTHTHTHTQLNLGERGDFLLEALLVLVSARPDILRLLQLCKQVGRLLARQLQLVLQSSAAPEVSESVLLYW